MLAYLCLPCGRVIKVCLAATKLSIFRVCSFGCTPFLIGGKRNERAVNLLPQHRRRRPHRDTARCASGGGVVCWGRGVHPRHGGGHFAHPDQEKRLRKEGRDPLFFVLCRTVIYYLRDVVGAVPYNLTPASVAFPSRGRWHLRSK